MNKSFQLFALSTTIKNFNSTLSTDINVIDIAEVEKILDGSATAAILFEKKHLKQILSICKRRVECKSRLICVGKDLSSDDRLVLLNHNIEFLTPEKFIEIGPYFFEVGLIESQPKVLIVEDDEDQIALTEHILYNANISVMAISKGEEVLEAIDSFNPDLVLMDLFLEGITGDKLVQAIRKVPIHRFLPIVFLTSDNSIESRMRVLNAGADDLLTKPINSDLLVSAIKNRIQRNHLFQSSVKNSQSVSIVHDVVELEGQKLNEFLAENKNNPSASIIWLKVKNKHSLLKKLGYSGFKNLCKKMFENIPIYHHEFQIKLELAEGVFVFAATDMDRKTTKLWVERLYKWLSKNYFSIQNKDYYFDISAIILADIPNKNNQDQLLKKAEHILIDGMINQPITFLEEGIEERHFYLVKTQLEKAIKTRNFNWQYQTIVSTQDESQEIYQLMLRVITDTGKELNSSDYLDIANKTGLLRLLDRFTLEHAIRIIRAGEQKHVKTRTLLNQILSDYQSSTLRHKKFEVIKKLKLPLGSMVFQFSKDDAVDYMSILGEVGRELTQTRIKICLSNFDCSNVAWKIARKLNVSWIRLRPFGKDDAILDTNNPNNLSKVIRKAHILGYKVIVSQVDSAGFAAELWKMNIDYLQGNFIQAPIKDVFDNES